MNLLGGENDGGNSPNKIAAVWLPTAFATPLCRDCKNAEFRMSYTQYKRYSLRQNNNDLLQKNTCFQVTAVKFSL
jgi:hypothetical protein